MKHTMWLSEFSCLSEYTRLYPILTFAVAGVDLGSFFTQGGFENLL